MKFHAPAQTSLAIVIARAGAPRRPASSADPQARRARRPRFHRACGSPGLQFPISTRRSVGELIRAIDDRLIGMGRTDQERGFSVVSIRPNEIRKMSAHSPRRALRIFRHHDRPSLNRSGADNAHVLCHADRGSKIRLTRSILFCCRVRETSAVGRCGSGGTIALLEDCHRRRRAGGAIEDFAHELALVIRRFSGAQGLAAYRTHRRGRWLSRQPCGRTGDRPCRCDSQVRGRGHRADRCPQ
jgi:hypothetical protein